MEDNERQQIKQMSSSLSNDAQWIGFLQSFGRMEGKLDLLLRKQEDQEQRAEEHDGRIRVLETSKDEDHEARIRVLERSHWRTAGIVAVVATALSTALSPILRITGVF